MRDGQRKDLQITPQEGRGALGGRGTFDGDLRRDQQREVDRMRDRLPPGLEKQLRRRGTLPPGLQKKVQPVPVGLERQLRVLPTGWRRVVVGGNIILMDEKTSLIYDVVRIAIP